MESVRLGRSGLRVSRVALGSMTFGGELAAADALRVLDRAFDLGITFFDTADVYPFPVDPATCGRAEEIIGSWLRGRRDAIVLATKCGVRTGPSGNDGGGGRKHVLESCDQSLRRLGTDHVDIYYLHNVEVPGSIEAIDETLEALDRLVQSGKIRYIGLSNCSAWHVALALEIIGHRHLASVSVIQNRYNLVHRVDERDLVPLARAAGIGLVPYNPLGGGVLAGELDRAAAPSGRFAFSPYRERYWSDEVFDVVDAVREVARAEGRTSAQVALAWTLAQPGVSAVLTGALAPQQVSDNVRAAEISLAAESIRMLERVSKTFC